jgi:hypothetical protein
MREVRPLGATLAKEYTKWSSGQRQKVKRILLQRDGNRCFYCRHVMTGDSKRRASIEHLTPRSFGGSNFFDNLALACAECNEARDNKCLVTYCENVQTIYLTLSEAMDYARMVSILTGNRMKVTREKSGRCTLTALDDSDTM